MLPVPTLLETEIVLPPRIALDLLEGPTVADTFARVQEVNREAEGES